jgi:hypothetical protein
LRGNLPVPTTTHLQVEVHVWAAAAMDLMSTSKFTEEQILGFLLKVEKVDETIETLCRNRGTTL